MGNQNTEVSQRQSWVTKWNWSGFIQCFAFGLGNRAYLNLLCLVPVLNLIWIFVAGFKTEKWARDNAANEYRDELEFRRIMDTWNRSGFVVFIISVVFMAAYFLFFGAMISAIIQGSQF